MSKFIKFVKAFIQALKDEKYRKDPAGSNLSLEQQTALNIGAINAEQVMYFCDSLKTGASLDEIASNLEEYYDINDKESAEETLEWLKNEGHRIYFDAFKQNFAQYTQGDKPSQIKLAGLDEEHAEEAVQYFNNMQETLEILTENGYLGSASELAAASVMAWDMGRLVLVARCCYECGYITEQQAWDYIFTAYRQCQDIYPDWKEFATGYFIGRLMWSGNNMTVWGIADIAENLVKHEKSPWKQTPFK